MPKRETLVAVPDITGPITKSRRTCGGSPSPVSISTITQKYLRLLCCPYRKTSLWAQSHYPYLSPISLHLSTTLQSVLLCTSAKAPITPSPFQYITDSQLGHGTPLSLTHPLLPDSAYHKQPSSSPISSTKSDNSSDVEDVWTCTCASQHESEKELSLCTAKCGDLCDCVAQFGEFLPQFADISLRLLALMM